MRTAEAEGVVCADERRLDVAQDGVDGQEGGMPGPGHPAAGDMRLVKDACAAHGGEAAQAVGDERGGRGKRSSGEGLNGLLGEEPLGQADERRLARLGGLHGCNEGQLFGRAAIGLAALDLATEVGVVDLDATGELSVGLAQRHRLHDLLLEQPSRGVGHAQVALELEGRDVVLGMRHQVHGQQRARQRHLAGLKDSAGHQAALMAAAAALKVQTLLATELAVPAAPAARADESIGPVPAAHEVLTLLLRPVLTDELGERQPPLVLHRVLRQGNLRQTGSDRRRGVAHRVSQNPRWAEPSC